MPVLVDPALVLAIGVAIATAAVYFYYFSPQANQPDIHPLQLAQQSSVSSTRESSSESAVYRSKLAPKGTPLVASPSNEVSTLRDLFRIGRRVHRLDAAKFCVGNKITKTSSEEIAARSIALAGGLLRTVSAAATACGSDVKAAAVCIASSVDFLVAYQACVEAGIVAIPIPITETPVAVEAILKHSKARVLIASNTMTYRYCASIKNSLLTHTIVVGDLDGSDASTAVRQATKVISFRELEQGEAPEQDAVIEPSDAAYVIYTADCDAQPHTEHGLLSNLPANQSFSAKDTFMSTSSMANATNLIFINLALMHGCSIAILDTIDAEKFAKTAYILEPTFLYLDPFITRDLVQLFHSHVVRYPTFEYKMFMTGYRGIVDSLKRGMTPKTNFWDLLYFRHYRNLIGGKVRLMYVDGPLTPSKSIEWLRAVHGAKVIPIFGTIQASAIITAGSYYDYASAIVTHNVGAPLACNEIKVVDSDKDTDGVALNVEGGANPCGILAVRGPNVCDSEWCADRQKKVEGVGSRSSDDGWLKLPIYAEILPNGTIDIIGSDQTVVSSPLTPTGHLFVERLECVLASSRIVTDVCVVAEPNARKLDIVAYPRPTELASAARKTKREYKLNSIDDYPWTAEYVRDKLIGIIRSTSGYEWFSEIPAADIRVKLVSEPFLVKNHMAHPDGSNNRLTAKKLLSKK
ncbi:hypothetical protein BX070DRAFT_252145 [Coemansia spiralis]|nr:hypothetical protein BX070DRAFT_252145 [Coemansia spiralis]